MPSCAPTEQGHEPSRLTTTCANDQRRSGHVVVVKISAPTARRITVKWFESPSGNISCEIDDQRPGIPDQAYCQTFTPAQSATLRPGGPVQICKGTGCVGNPPDDDTPLPYGSSTSLARSGAPRARDGVTCTIGAGTGFRISRAGIAQVRPR